MISATEMFLQQYHPMADGLLAQQPNTLAAHDRETSHGCVLYCTFRASRRPYSPCSERSAESDRPSARPHSERTGLRKCERMSQGALLNLLTRSDATFRGAMGGSSPNP
jgi:hypothetical protein